MNRFPNPSTRVSTPLPPPTSSPNSPQLTQDLSTHKDVLQIIHLNCHLRLDVTEHILTQVQYDVIALQEPHINAHTLRPPAHPAWNLFLLFDYHPTDYQTRHLSCIYVSKRFPTHTISLLRSGSNVLTAVEIQSTSPDFPNLRIISCYNPPADHRGLPTLKNWLNTFNLRQTPTILMMDTNLHSPVWSAPHTTCYSLHSSQLLNICGSTSFKLISPKGVPTFIKNGIRPTAIDLIWANWKLSPKVSRC